MLTLSREEAAGTPPCGGDAIAASPRTGAPRISCLRSPSIPGNAISRGREGRARRCRQPQSPVRGAATLGPQSSAARAPPARCSRALPAAAARARARAAVTAAAAAPRAGARSRDGAGWLGRARPLCSALGTARHGTERHRTERRGTAGRDGTAPETPHRPPHPAERHFCPVPSRPRSALR